MKGCAKLKELTLFGAVTKPLFLISTPEFSCRDPGQHWESGSPEVGYDLHYRRCSSLVLVYIPGVAGKMVLPGCVTSGLMLVLSTH